MNVYIPRGIKGQSKDSQGAGLPAWNTGNADLRQKKSEKPSSPDFEPEVPI